MLNLCKNKFNGKNTAELISSGARMDLHIHTCYSDGVLTPEQVVDRWRSEGYEIIAITDHDGIEGSVIAHEYAMDSDIQIIPGIEFDSSDPVGKDIHILGYGFDYDDPGLTEVLKDILIKRAKRNDQLLEALNNRGYNITDSEIYAINEGRYVGKPTFARILKNKGVVDDIDDVFNNLYREPEFRVIRKVTLPSKDVIDIIHRAGGIAVVAHPMEQRHKDEPFEDFRPRLYEFLDRMTEYGIDGVECYHPSADEGQQELLRSYAEKHDLLITRGSDFHSEEHKRNFSRYHGM